MEPPPERSKRLHNSIKRGVDEEEMDKDEKLNFSVSLLKTKFAEDFSNMIRNGSPKRHKKRPRVVQKKKLNLSFVGKFYGLV